MSQAQPGTAKSNLSPLGWCILLVVCAAGGVLIIRDNIARNDVVKQHCPPDQITFHVKSFKPYLRELRCAVPLKQDK
jgi:hypothetical protein